MTSTNAAKSALRDNEIAMPKNVATDHQIALRFPSRYSARNQPRQTTERIADGRTARSGPTPAIERIATRMNTIDDSWKHLATSASRRTPTALHAYAAIR